MDCLPTTPAPFAPGELWADDVEDQIQQQTARSLSSVIEGGPEDSDGHETGSTASDSDEDSLDPTPASAYNTGKSVKKGKGGTTQTTEAADDLTKGSSPSGRKLVIKIPATSTTPKTPSPDNKTKAPAAPNVAQNKRSWAAVVGSHNAPTSGPVQQTGTQLGTPESAPPSRTATAGKQADLKNRPIHPSTYPPSPTSPRFAVQPSARPSVQPSDHAQVGPSIMKQRTWAEMAAMKPPDWPEIPAPSLTVQPASVNMASSGTTATLAGKGNGDGKNAASFSPNASLQSRAEVLKQVSTPPIATSSIVATPSATAALPTAASPPVVGTHAQAQTPSTDSKLSATANPFTPGDRHPAPSPPSMPSSCRGPRDWAVPVEEAFHEPSLIRPPPKGPPGFIPGGIVGYTQGVHFTIGEIPLPPGITHQQLWDEFQQTKRPSTARSEPPEEETAMPPPPQPYPRPCPGTNNPEAAMVERTRQPPPPPRAYAEVASAGMALPPMSRPHSGARTASPELARTEATDTTATPPPRSTSPSEPPLPSPISPVPCQTWEGPVAGEGDRYACSRRDGRAQTLQDRSGAASGGLSMPGTLYTIHQRDRKGAVTLMGEPRLCEVRGVVESDGEAIGSSLTQRPTHDMAVQTSPRGRCHVATQTRGDRPGWRATSPFPPLPTVETSDAMVQTKRVKTKSEGTSPSPVESCASSGLGDSRRPSLAEPPPRGTASLPTVAPCWGPPEPAASGSLQNVSITRATTAAQPEDPNPQTSPSRGGTGESRPSKTKKKKGKKRTKAKRANKEAMPNASAFLGLAAENTGLEQGAAKERVAKHSTAGAAVSSADDRKEGKEKPREEAEAEAEEEERAPQSLWARARAYSPGWLFGR